MIPTRLHQQVGHGVFSGLYRLGNQMYALVALPDSYHVFARYEQFPDRCLTTTKSDGVLNTQILKNIGLEPALQISECSVDNAEWYIMSECEMKTMQKWLCNNNPKLTSDCTPRSNHQRSPLIKRNNGGPFGTRMVASSTIFECTAFTRSVYASVGYFTRDTIPDGVGPNFRVKFVPIRRILITGE